MSTIECFQSSVWPDLAPRPSRMAATSTGWDAAAVDVWGDGPGEGRDVVAWGGGASRAGAAGVDVFVEGGAAAVFEAGVGALVVPGLAGAVPG